MRFAVLHHLMILCSSVDIYLEVVGILSIHSLVIPAQSASEEHIHCSFLRLAALKDLSLTVTTSTGTSLMFSVVSYFLPPAAAVLDSSTKEFEFEVVAGRLL